jgi:hypothetical protein
MHRLYSMFPLGRPGVGLVLLRLAVAITLWPLPGGLAAWLGEQPVLWCAGALFIALLAGAFTPVAASLCLLLKCMAFAEPVAVPLEYLFAATLISLALLWLGPGAYSLDSQLYGHRVMTLRARH